MAKADFYEEDYDLSKLSKQNLKLGIIVSSFNKKITKRLLDGAILFLSENGFKEKNYDVFKVPGAFEIPYLCNRLCLKGGYDGLITLGAVIRGETSHYDYVCSESARGIMEVGLKYSIPISYGILTCENEAQAIERSGGAHGDKGMDAAYVVLNLIITQQKYSI